MESSETEEKLQENVAVVMELLSQQKRSETIVHRRSQHNQALIESLVTRQHLVKLQQHLSRLHTADIAHILETLPTEDRICVWEQILDDREGDVLLDVADAVRENLIAGISEEQLLKALNLMDADDLAYIADDIPENLLKVRKETLTTEDKNWLSSAMNYEEDTAGFLMSNEMVVVYAHQSLEEAAKKLRSLEAFPIHNDTLFVVDRRGLLKGILSLKNILLNNPDALVQNIMEEKVIKFAPLEDAAEVSQAFERYDLISAPVVNERGKLIGRLTVDVVMDYIRDEATEDVLNMAGISSEEDLFAPILHSTKNRALWLGVNLFAAFLISRLIGFFEGTISQLVALAALMPIVASVGGNTGNQTAVLIIRGITLGQISDKNTRYLIRKELGVSSLNGLMTGLTVGIFSYVFYQNLALSLVIAFAMLLTIIVAALLGLSVPLMLEKMGRDPALGASVITTAAVDSVGFFIFLGLASLFLI